MDDQMIMQALAEIAQELKRISNSLNENGALLNELKKMNEHLEDISVNTAEEDEEDYEDEEGEEEEETEEESTQEQLNQEPVTNEPQPTQEPQQAPWESPQPQQYKNPYQNY